MATIDEELAQMEKDIRQLKVEYDQYFGGGRKRPPTEIEWRIDQIVKRYAERGGELKAAQRFRMNNLAQTYAKYKDIFRKKAAQKEEGKIQHHFGAAAKAIEAERAKKHAEEEAAAAEQGAAKDPASKGVAVRSAGARNSGAAERGAFRMVCSAPEHETENVDKLFNAFVSAKKQAGEETAKLSKESFNEFVKKKTSELQKQKNCKEVEYVVDVVNGQVKLKALVKS
jgi:hypothetical protein